MNTVIDTIENVLAAGISYELIIKTTGNLYMLSGNTVSGLFLDVTNSEAGTLPTDLVSYDDINYDAGLLGISAVYTSLYMIDVLGFSELVCIGVGNVFFQYRELGGAWSAEQDATGEQIFTLSGTEIQFRFIFKSELWSDPDSIIVTRIS